MLCRWELRQTTCALTLVGVLLSIVNLLLMYRLNPQDIEKSNTDVNAEVLREQLDFSILPLDASGQYRIQSFFLSPKMSKRDLVDVTMVTHCTVNHLHYLVDMSAVWKGPVSVALLVPGAVVVTAYRIVLGLNKCWATIRNQVTVHIVYPLSHPPKDNHLEQYLIQALKTLPSCEKLVMKGRIKSNLFSRWNYANIKIPYPNNLLRNTALKRIQTEYVFVVDVDMLCSGTLYHDFLEFADKKKLFYDKSDKKVFVIPAFESTYKLDPSVGKQQLINLWNKGSVQPFYYTVCWKCQNNTDYDQWKLSNQKKLDIAYSVEWKDPWEPFYIGPKHIPFYDERFKQYGFNRISQVCETHVAGYTFVVLNNGFLVHHGFKKKENFHSNKDKENARNRDLFRKFKRELKVKYPDSMRRC